MDYYSVAVLTFAAAFVGCSLFLTPRAMRSAPPKGALAKAGHQAAQWAADPRMDPADTEHVVYLGCLECGSRQIPPVDSVDTPLSYSDLALVALAEAGYVATSTCKACDTPLTSRKLTAAEAEQARRFGAVDVDPGAAVDEFIASL